MALILGEMWQAGLGQHLDEEYEGMGRTNVVVKSGKQTATCDAVFVARHGDHFVDVEGWDLKSEVF